MITLAILILLAYTAIIVFMIWAIHTIAKSLKEISIKLSKQNAILAAKNNCPIFDEE